MEYQLPFEKKRIKRSILARRRRAFPDLNFPYLHFPSSDALLSEDASPPQRGLGSFFFSPSQTAFLEICRGIGVFGRKYAPVVHVMCDIVPFSGEESQIRGDDSACLAGKGLR